MAFIVNIISLAEIFDKGSRETDESETDDKKRDYMTLV